MVKSVIFFDEIWVFSQAPLQWVSFARLYTTASWKELLGSLSDGNVGTIGDMTYECGKSDMYSIGSN